MPPDRPQWTDPAASLPGQYIWQFIGVWLLGGCAPFVLDGVAHGFELGGAAFTVATVVMLTGVVLGLIALLFLLVRATSLVTPLGTTRGRRLLWAVLVAAGGGIAWLLGRTLVNANGLGVMHNGRMAVFLGGGLAALVAAVLTRGWWLRGPAAVALIVLAGTGLVAYRDTGPTELDMRLADAGWTKEDTWVVDIPGYHPSHRTFGLAADGDEYHADDVVAEGPGWLVLKAINISTGCQPPRCGNPDYLLLASLTPTIYRGGQTRLAVRRGHYILELTSVPGADLDRLKAAMEATRQATDDELMAALPPSRAHDPAEALRNWLRRHT